MSPTPAGPASAPGEPAAREHSRRLLAVVAALAAFATLYVLLPRVAGLDETWRRLHDGDPWWLAAALVFEGLSFAGYFVLFRAVISRFDAGVSLRDAYAITMAGVVATRLVATAGAGGVALTAWALRRRGMTRQAVAAAITAFLVILYAVFMAALVSFGLALWSGLLPGAPSTALTLGPAAVGAAIAVTALVVARMRWSVGAGVREALAAVRGRDPRLLGAVAWWGCDIAVLWATFQAFGDPPLLGVLAMGYFIGMLGNVLPLPGGIGGVEGGMIGAYVAFGVPAGLAIVAVLSYRAFAFWLPTVPGVFAYGQLRRGVDRRSNAGELGLG
jgi:uncharacterized membrane protein YbhN (UPF0104 family)